MGPGPESYGWRTPPRRLAECSALHTIMIHVMVFAPPHRTVANVRWSAEATPWHIPAGGCQLGVRSPLALAGGVDVSTQSTRRRQYTKTGRDII